MLALVAREDVNVVLFVFALYLLSIYLILVTWALYTFMSFRTLKTSFELLLRLNFSLTKLGREVIHLDILAFVFFDNLNYFARLKLLILGLGKALL